MKKSMWAWRVVAVSCEMNTNYGSRYTSSYEWTLLCVGICIEHIHQGTVVLVWRRGTITVCRKAET